MSSINTKPNATSPAPQPAGQASAAPSDATASSRTVPANLGQMVLHVPTAANTIPVPAPAVQPQVPAAASLALRGGSFALGPAELSVPAGGSLVEMRPLQVPRSRALTQQSALLAATFLGAAVLCIGAGEASVGYVLAGAYALTGSRLEDPALALALLGGLFFHGPSLSVAALLPLGVQVARTGVASLRQAPAPMDVDALELTPPISLKVTSKNGFGADLTVARLWSHPERPIGMHGQLLLRSPYGNLPALDLDSGPVRALLAMVTHGAVVGAANRQAITDMGKSLNPQHLLGQVLGEEPAPAAAVKLGQNEVALAALRQSLHAAFAQAGLPAAEREALLERLGAQVSGLANKSAQAEAGPDVEKIVRTGFNVLLDRTRLADTQGHANRIALHGGRHVLSGLGVATGLAAADRIFIDVAPGTRASLATGEINQTPGVAPAPRSAFFVRMAAAIGHLFAAALRAVRALFGYATAAAPDAPAMAASSPTDPNGRLYAHGVRLRLNKRINVSLGNWSRHVLSASIFGADVDDVGGIRPRGSVRLFGVPVFSLNSRWLRDTLESNGLNLTTDPHRLLWQGLLFAADAPAPAPAATPVAETQLGREARLAAEVAANKRAQQAQSAFSASVLGFMGSLLGEVEINVVPHALAVPRLQQVVSAGPSQVAIHLQRTSAPFQVNYNIHQFQKPIELSLHNLELDAQLSAGEKRPVGTRLALRLGELRTRTFWLDPMEAGELQDVRVQGLELGLRTPHKGPLLPLARVPSASFERSEKQGHAKFSFERTGDAAGGLGSLLGQLGGVYARAEVRQMLRMFGALSFSQPWAGWKLAKAFAPGAPKAPMASGRAPAPAPQAETKSPGVARAASAEKPPAFDAFDSAPARSTTPPPSYREKASSASSRRSSASA